MNISTLGSPSSSPISGKAIAAELEMAVLKKLKSNADQVGTALVELIQESASPCDLAHHNSTSTPRFNPSLNTRLVQLFVIAVTHFGGCWQGVLCVMPAQAGIQFRHCHCRASTQLGFPLSRE